MKISVALCTYNGEKYIAKQLDSIISQSCKVDEIVVCDDVSADSTLSILESYSRANPGLFRIFKNDVNLRSNKNFEKAVQLCTGDYIFFSDQDDIWVRDKIEKTISVFNVHPAAEGVFSNAMLIDDYDAPYTNKSLWDLVRFFESEYQKPVDIFTILTQTGNVVTGATFCIKKDVVGLVLPFPQSKHLYHDEWITFLLSKSKTLYYTPEKLIHYRLHGQQQVGVGKVDNENKALHDHNILQGRVAPSGYSDYKVLARQHYRNYIKFKDIARQATHQSLIDFDALSAYNLEKFKAAEGKMLRANPILYLSRKLSDRIKGKRKL